MTTYNKDQTPRKTNPNTKKSKWTYKKAQIKTVHGKLSPKLMLIDKSTGVTWLYSPAGLAERMPNNIESDECYLGWLGSWHRQGFCLMQVLRANDPNAKSGQMNAQRLIKAIELDRPLIKGEAVVATCNNPACLNIKHLIVSDIKTARLMSGNMNGNYVTSKYTDEWMSNNLDMILLTSYSKLAKALDITPNQAQYLRALARKKKSNYSVINLSSRKRI